MYYHCTGYRGKCPEPYIREEVLEKQFAAGLRELVIPREVLAWLQEELVASDVIERALASKLCGPSKPSWSVSKAVWTFCMRTGWTDVNSRLKSADVSTSARTQGYRQPGKL